MSGLAAREHGLTRKPVRVIVTQNGPSRNGAGPSVGPGSGYDAYVRLIHGARDSVTVTVTY